MGSVGEHHREGMAQGVARHIGAADARGLVVDDGVAFESGDVHVGVAVEDDGARGELRVSCLGVVDAPGGKDGVVFACDFRLADDAGEMGVGIVIERICAHGESVAVVDEHHVMVEVGVLRGRGILAVDRRKGVDLVVDGAAAGIPSEFGREVIVERVGGEGHVAVDEPDLLTRRAGAEPCHTPVAVVEEDVGIHEEGVALLHAHIAEGVERVELRIIVCRVAIHPHPGLAEPHVPLEDLVFRGVAPFHGSAVEAVGVLEKHLVGLVSVGRGNHRAYRPAQRRPAVALLLLLAACLFLLLRARIGVMPEASEESHEQTGHGGRHTLRIETLHRSGNAGQEITLSSRSR